MVRLEAHQVRRPHALLQLTVQHGRIIVELAHQHGQELARLASLREDNALLRLLELAPLQQIDQVGFLHVLRHEEESLGEACDGARKLLVQILFLLVIVHELVAAHGYVFFVEILPKELLFADVAVVVGCHGGREQESLTPAVHAPRSLLRHNVIENLGQV